MKKLLVFLCAVSLIFGIAGAANAYPVQLVENGGFETGDLTGWDFYANVEAQTDTVYSGTYSAGMSVGTLEGRIFKRDTNQYSAILVQELEGYETTYLVFDASFAYNVDVLRDIRILPDDKLFVGYLAVASDDWDNVVIYGGAELVVEGDSSGWQLYNNQVDLSGESIDALYLGFYFADGAFSGGSIDASNAFLDAVSVTANPIPEPATMLLFGSGLIGLAGARRKLKK